MKGVDVNGAKGPIDWRKVHNAGFEFAFLKATEGRTFNDERYNFNRRAAKAAGLKVGAYHFARPDNNSPEAEASHFLRVARPQRGELLPVLDWETAPPTASWAVRFLQIVERAIGAAPILYTFPDFLRRTGSFGQLRRFPLWYARFGPNDGGVHPANPPQGFQFAVHQFTSRGHVPGIGGSVDLDLLKLASLDHLVLRPGLEAVSLEETEDEGALPPESEAELPENAEDGEGVAGEALEKAGDRAALEDETFAEEAVPS
jgi:lysozyme